jgi:hypothetical protein
VAQKFSENPSLEKRVKRRQRDTKQTQQNVSQREIDDEKADGGKLRILGVFMKYANENARKS